MTTLTPKDLHEHILYEFTTTLSSLLGCTNEDLLYFAQSCGEEVPVAMETTAVSILVLRGGTVVIETAQPLDPSAHDEHVGVAVAKKKADAKALMLLGHAYTLNRANARDNKEA